MSSEYILFKKPELNELEKTFLITQLSILNTIKNLRAYRKTRMFEFTNKIQIKSVIAEIGNELLVLDKVLPETTLKPKVPQIFEQENQLISQSPFQEQPSTPTLQLPEKKRDALEEELERIRQRLSLMR